MLHISSGGKEREIINSRVREKCPELHNFFQLTDTKIKRASWRLMGFGLSLGIYLMYDLTGSRQVQSNTVDFGGSGA